MTKVGNEVHPVLSLERERCAALAAGDLERVASLISPRLVYVHSVGIVHNHGEFLRFLRDEMRFDTVERQMLHVVGATDDVAWMTGLMRIEGRWVQGGKPPIASVSLVSQVWARCAQCWRMELLHSTQVHASRWQVAA
ncbi:MAG: hypothetical protein OJF60_001123 [Burkholderiaceae bacterium]|jgi:hypothetical protein|nr:MAG: hypothetical protein OJF60_001123 [Burkholderiaceae bacterium]